MRLAGRFVLAGGVAVVLHGVPRTTAGLGLAIDPPLPYAELAASADLVEAEGLRLPIAGLRHLIRMKQHAGRAQDLSDAEALRRVLEASSD
jgi:hypothetical protein